MQRSGLGTSPELYSRLVAQDPQRIASRTGGNGNGWIHRGTGRAIADGDVALLIHCATAHPARSGVWLVSSRLEDNWCSARISHLVPAHRSVRFAPRGIGGI